MGNFKNQIIDFYKRDRTVRFSKNLWLDLLGHACIGLAVGTIMVLIRGTNPMPTLLLLTTVTTLWGLRGHLRRKKEGQS
jgi:hypothetical protein